MEKKVVVVCGPTASGKTSLAVSIAEKLGSGIISADSRQVYRGMDLGTGKDLFEYGDVPHHCIDVANPEDLYTLYHFQRDAYRALGGYQTAGQVPVLCGGTGLYIEAVLKKYEIANVPEDVPFREAMMPRDKSALAAELQALSPEQYAKTDISSKKRIVRALEIARAMQEGAVAFSTDEAVETSPLILITDWDRDTLIERIDYRLHQRLVEGMVDEVQRLIDAGVSAERLDLFGMEYRQIGAFLHKKVGYEEMVATLAQEIHRLAKRQRTWFRGMERRGFAVHWVKEARFDAAWEIVEREGFARM